MGEARRAAVTTGYLPSLDGWRAVAILGVLLTHDRPWNLLGHSSESYKGYGGFGVYLFFAISGFLITTRILEENRISGYFNIRSFYLRRLFRIQPAAWVYLATVAVLIATGVARDSWPGWVSALLLYANFLYGRGVSMDLTGHFWTLAVEEHFYILLSFTLLALLRYRRLIPAVSVIVGLYLIFMLPASQELLTQHGWLQPRAFARATLWQLPALIMGAVSAALVRRPAILKAVKTLLWPWAGFLLTVVLMASVSIAGQVHQILHYHWSILRLRPFRAFSVQLVFGSMYLMSLWVVSTVFHPNSLTTRFLELKPMLLLGKISYSLYLWHVVVYRLWDSVLFSGNGVFAHLQPGQMPYTLLERPLRLATAIGLATLSYYFIEKPMIRRGHILAPPATPGRPELADLPVEEPQRHVFAPDRVG